MSTQNLIRHTTVIAALILTACATAESRHDVITGRSGMTMYTFDKDVAGSGKSACEYACAARWPAAPATEAKGPDFGSIGRVDGQAQLTYRGRPVYFYVGDRKPGDVMGDGVRGVWHALRKAPPPGVGDGYTTQSSYSY
jgi:predicted lipoprotein with Yx(FWY)xxD motif